MAPKQLTPSSKAEPSLTVFDPAAVSMAAIGAHRGATATAAENSLAAFEAAIRLGVEFIEFDVRRTSDQTLIVLHDATIGGEPVAALTSEAIFQKSGVRPPRLAEVLELAGGRIGLDVELKEGGYVAEVVDAVRRGSEPERIVYTSFLDTVIRQVGSHEPAAKTGLILGRSSPAPYLRTRLSEIFPAQRLRRCGATFAVLHYQLAKLGALRRAHAAGVPTLVWTVNGASPLRRFLSNPLVYGVITDQPQQALVIRDSLGQSAVPATLPER